MNQTSTDDGVRKVADLIKGIKTCMLTTVDGQGHLVARPMSVQEVEFDGDLWFFSDGDSRKVDQIEHGASAGVTFSSRGSWVSLTGKAELVHDTAKAQQLWNATLDAWFPDGPSTPGLTMVKIHAEGAQYWDTPGGSVATLFSFAKAKVSGTRYDGGESEVVTMPAGS